MAAQGVVHWHVDSHPPTTANIGNWWAKEATTTGGPPPNAMGCFGFGGSDGDLNGKRERKRRHKQIQKMIQHDKQVYRATHRLLLLGKYLLSSAHSFVPAILDIYYFWILFIYLFCLLMKYLFFMMYLHVNDLIINFALWLFFM